MATEVKDLGYGITEYRSPITLRQLQEEKDRLKKQKIEQIVRYPFTTKIHWLPAAKTAARDSGIRLECVGLPGDIITIREHIDLKTYERVIVTKMVAENNAALMVTASSPRRFKLFKDLYEIELYIS